MNPFLTYTLTFWQIKFEICSVKFYNYESIYPLLKRLTKCNMKYLIAKCLLQTENVQFKKIFIYPPHRRSLQI